ncbi:MAG: TatD family deoxyribonuclease [Acidimicrobiales bacterium]|nr:TatD family hydrolase [Hyphomonadaceae bacterium]RZV42789.1 MAG: TatD family deoxyribonuclease [Acidimicrobiales bacterium]
MFVDSHVNLHGEQFEDDLDAVVERAWARDVSTMLTICCKLSEFEPVLAVAEKFDNMFASVGTHPHEARENPDIKPEDLIEKSRHPKVIGIGETGLDFHYNYSDRDVQFTNFHSHIVAARKTQLPLIIHSRNADTEMADLLETEMKKGAFPALLHCYTGGEDLARRAADLGLYFSLSGILSFKNANALRKIARSLPEDRILIETDCPYLAPVPYRGRRNEPSYVVEVAQALADVKQWSLETTAQKTSEAFYNLFKKATRPT